MDDRGSQLGREPEPRSLRGAKRALQRFLGLEEPAVDEQGLIDALHLWVLGLPFVEELEPTPSAPDIRRFAVSCPDLDSGAVVLLTGAFEMGDDDYRDIVMAVLPRRIAREIAAAGSLGPDLPDNRCLVAMKAPVSPDELRVLEDVLLMAYCSAFPAG